MSDPVEQHAEHSASEDTDEDRLQVDPLEEGVEPPEHWSAANRFGMTAREQQEGESLDQKLHEEQPEPEEPEIRDRPIAATPAEELDDSVDDVAADVEPVAPEERLDAPGSSAPDRQLSDEAGGSVADWIRTPPGEARI
ncbi:hypothetical protein CFN78_27020 [Amycolatopsis antarctica]|uniref:DUF5709 domain-containing protein n=1 Tax=Amycolatopsis antarctica TaxID=1854586 RepID=A0A263CVI0_9PSEU|nr:hypothetical protein [Amycolatopsis antarctica]OZM70124.1 hypothetical protein CFN78_27020 [Amycolatopsis antarctica]